MTPHSDFVRHQVPGAKKIGATTVEEQAWCRWYAAEVFTGRGALVEWGPWLGSLTASYCEGLARNARVAGKKGFVHIYDLFTWSEIFEQWSAGTPHAGRFQPGDDFRDYFCALHAGCADFLQVHRADLSREPGPGVPIEWIINDATKSLPIATHVFEAFIPGMLPGESHLAHQDFLWGNDSFIQVLMFLARDSFVFEFVVPNSCMTVFRNTKPFDPAVLRAAGLPGGLDAGLIHDAFAWSARTLTGVNPRLLALCESATLRDFGHLEAARRVARETRFAESDGGDAGEDDGMLRFQLETLGAWGYAEIWDAT